MNYNPLIARLLSYRAQVLQGYRHISREDEATLILEAVAALYELATEEGDAADLLVSHGTGYKPDAVCEHGTAMDVHCCNCHSGFIFESNHECPDPKP